MNVIHVSTVDELAETGTRMIAEVLRAAIAERGRASLALSGGSTPRPVYERLAREPLDWPLVDLFQGDERCVPPEDPASNQAMLRESLTNRAGLLPRDMFFIARGQEVNAEEAAKAYEEDLCAYFGRCEERLPAFDLILLGLGPDGHTASLFPGSRALAETKRWVVPVAARELGEGVEPRVDRVTLTLPVLNAARRVLFLIGAHGKEAALERFLNETSAPDDEPLPAQRVQPAGELDILIID